MKRLHIAIFLFIGIYTSLASVQKSSSSPYSVLADYLLRSDRKNKDFLKYSSKQVEKAVKKLASGQKAMKTMDGMSHMLNSAVSKKRFVWYHVIVSLSCSSIYVE